MAYSQCYTEQSYAVSVCKAFTVLNQYDTVLYSMYCTGLQFKIDYIYFNLKLNRIKIIACAFRQNPVDNACTYHDVDAVNSATTVPVVS